MVSNTEQILAAALNLPRDERATVIDELMRSLDDADDAMDPEDRQRLHAAIARSEDQFRAGQGISAVRVYAVWYARRGEAPPIR